MNTYSLSEIALIEAAHLLHPLRTVSTSGQAQALLSQLGYAVPAADLVQAFTGVSAKTDKVIADAVKLIWTATDEEKLEAIPPLMLSVKEAVDEFAQLEAALRAAPGLAQDFVNNAPLNQLPRRLLDFLLFQNLYRRYPKLFGALHLMGILEEDLLDKNDAIFQPDCRLKVVRWERLPRYFSEPGGVVDEIYQWKTDFDSDEFFTRFVLLMRAMAIAGGLYRQSDMVRRALGNSTAGLAEIRLPVFTQGVYPGQYAQFGFSLTPAEAANGQKKGLAFLPYLAGASSFNFDFSDDWEASLQTSLNLDAGIGMILRPPLSIDFLDNLFTTPLEAGSAGFALSVRQKKDPGGQVREFFLFGSQSKTHLSASGISLKLFGTRNSPGDDAGIELEIDKISLLFSGGDGDSFIAKILPQSGVKANFGLGIGYSAARSVYFKGSATIEIVLPTHIQLGPVDIQEITVAVRMKDATIPVEVSANIKAKLGPIVAVIENLGISSTFSFPPDRNGRLGPVDFKLGFKPPNGAGMSINASAITGGGYLLFDQEKEQYAGILYLSVKDKIAITAIGLLTTRLPDGRKGFSLLLIITAEFPPIQLGYGFVLLGVGGLVGVNRTMLLDVLRAGIKNKTLDAILFPKNPIANAPKIISDLQAVFPPAEGRFVFGPMAKIAWGGAYPILTIELGILIELGLQAGLPASVRLALLGKVTLALPRREKPEDKVIVYLNLDIIGLVDFDKSDASLDATLFDSRIAEFPITGDMAMRLNWGASSTFVMAAGGFHPRFQPPPNFPALDRLAISIAKGDNPRLRLESYMAITANTVQFGARLDVYVAYAGFTGAAFLAFDALVEFPFHMVVDIAGGVVVKWKGNAILTATLYLTLSGPGPWSAVGEATFHFLGFKRQLPINLTSGEVVTPEPLPPSQPFVQLQNQFKDAQNWSAQLPAAENMNVTLRQVAVGKGVLVHPLGSLTVRQTAVPLDVAISRFANTTPDTPGPFVVEKITFGNGAAVAEQKSAEVRDNFAPAQFFQMSDEEKLGSPAFQPLPAGRTRIGTIQIKCSEKPISRALGYDTVVIDALETRAARRAEDGISAYAMPSGVLAATAALGAAGRSPLRSTGSATYAGPTDGQVKLKDPEYIVASAEDMSVDAETGSQPSEVEARQRLKQKGARGYQVVGSHEVI
jgi:hypothetical protein